MSEQGSEKVFVPGLFERAKTVRFNVVLGELGLLDELKIVGDEIRGKCPLCRGERSFSANPSKGMFHCFRCRKKKNVIDFVAFYQNIEPKQAAEWLVSLLPPAEVSEEQAEKVIPRSEGLTAREMRLLHIIVRANARCVATLFEKAFADVVTQLEEMARQIATEEMATAFPEVPIPAEES